MLWKKKRTKEWIQRNLEEIQKLMPQPVEKSSGVRYSIPEDVRHSFSRSREERFREWEEEKKSPTFQERLRMVLAEDARYIAGYNRVTVEGPDAIIDRMKQVQKRDDLSYRAARAVLEEVPDGSAHEEGEKCLSLLASDRKAFESLAFIRCNDEGYITTLETLVDDRYGFRLDS